MRDWNLSNLRSWHWHFNLISRDIIHCIYHTHSVNSNDFEVRLQWEDFKISQTQFIFLLWKIILTLWENSETALLDWVNLQTLKKQFTQWRDMIPQLSITRKQWSKTRLKLKKSTIIWYRWVRDWLIQFD